MFGKKILGLVGALFIGSQVISVVEASELKSCDDASLSGFTSGTCTNEGPATAYCIEGLKIYGLNGNSGNACVKDTEFTLTGDKLSIVKASDKEEVDEDSFSSAFENLSTTPANYDIVDCRGSECRQTTGYVKVNGAIYGFTVASGGAISSGFVATGVDDEAKCTSSHIGKLLSGVEAICIHEEKSATMAAEDDEYLIKKTTATGTPFEDGSNDIAIKRTASYIVKNAFDSGDDKGVYIEYDTNKIIDRNTNFCSGTILNKLYICTGGICNEQDGTVEAGKYLVKGQMYEFKDAAGKLNIEKKSGDSETDIFVYGQADETDTTYSTLIEDFTFAELAENTFIYDCKKGVCTKTNGYIKYGTAGSESLAYCDGSDPCASAQTANTKCDAANDEGNVQLDESNPKKLHLCIKPEDATPANRILDVNGGGMFIVVNQSKYLKFKTSGNTVGLSAQASGYYLVKNNVYITDGTSGGTLVKCDGNCVEHNGASNTYANSVGNGLIVCTTGACVLNATPAEGYIVDGDAKLVKCESNKCEVVSNGSNEYYLSNANKLIYCVSDGNCDENTVVGVYEDSGNAASLIKCESESACDTLTIASLNSVECNSGTIGQLIQDGKLCLDGTISKGFSDADDYLVSYHASSIFETIVLQNEFGVVEITANSMTIKDVDVPVCAEKSNLQVKTVSCTDGVEYTSCTNGRCTPAGASCDPESPTAACKAKTYYLKSDNIFYCVTQNNCGSAIYAKGYYINFDGNDIGNVYTCNGTSGGCAEKTSDDSLVGIGCTGSDIGKIYKSGDREVSLCVADSTPVKLADKDSLIMLAKHENSVLGTSGDQYSIVSMKSNSLSLKADYKNTLKYVYVLRSTSEILVRGEGGCVPENNDEYSCTSGVCTKI